MFRYYFFHYGIPLFTNFKNIFESIMNDVYYYYDNIKRVSNSDELIFFHNNSNAYLSSFIDTNNKNSGVVIWKYNRYYNIFYSYNCSLKDKKHFPILSGSLICDNFNINLDNFFEDIMVENSNPNFPNLQQVIEVYSYLTGIVFDRTKPWKLNYLDNNLNEVTLDIFKESWTFTDFTKN